jgi:hypothetical protein
MTTPAADNVQRRGSSSSWRALFLFILAVLQVLVVCRLVEQLSAPGATFLLNAAPSVGD